MNEWISVEERLPRVNRVIVWAESYDDRPFMAIHTSSGWYDLEDRDCDGDYPWVFGVTHWMPLPEPPDNHAPSDCDPTGRNIESGPGQ